MLIWATVPFFFFLRTRYLATKDQMIAFYCCFFFFKLAELHSVVEVWLEYFSQSIKKNPMYSFIVKWCDLFFIFSVHAVTIAFIAVNCIVLVCFFVRVFLQTESSALSRGDVGRGERRRPGGHAVGNPDVPVWKKGNHPVSGKMAAEQLNPQENGTNCRLNFKANS